MIDAKKLRELAEKATGGHWASPTANLFTIHSWDLATQEPTRCICEVPSDAAWGDTKLSWEDGATEPAANMRLICALRNSLPEILSLAERCGRLEEALKEIADTRCTDASTCREFKENVVAAAQAALALSEGRTT